MKKIAAVFLLVVLTAPAMGAERTAKFSVPAMTCPLCPLTITAAMSNVDGVISATADFDTKTAMAVFDDAKTSQAALAQASADAGYPATLLSEQ